MCSFNFMVIMEAVVCGAAALYHVVRWEVFQIFSLSSLVYTTLDGQNIRKTFQYNGHKSDSTKTEHHKRHEGRIYCSAVVLDHISRS